MTTLILGLSASYALLAGLLAWLVIASRAHLLIKLAVTIAVVIAAPLTYRGIGELRGLPSDAEPPPSFQLFWAKVDEPNPLTDDPGSVFLWIQKLDEDNFPTGLPRAYQLPYEEDLVRKVEVALGRISDGEEVGGVIEDEASGETAEELAEEEAEEAADDGPDSSMIGDRGFQLDPGDLVFGERPAPRTPEKPD
ncbi:hypothetical protein ACXN5S_02600 [Pseudoroseicyclus sp. H15]